MEEPICEIHSFFNSSSSISNEAKQENPMYGMEESVSFGRFTSESLSWEKWSTFNRNRYVEEAEKYSRPGSVKQKRAFLEAHFKKVTTLKDVSSSPDQTTTIQEAPSESNIDNTSISNTHNEKEVETVDFGDDLIKDKLNNEEVQLSTVKVVESDQEAQIQPTILMDVEKQNPVTETQRGLVKTEEFSLQSSSIDDSNSAPALIKRNPPLSSYIPSVESGAPEVHQMKEMDNKYSKNDQNKKKTPFYKSINRKLGRLVKKIGISSKGSKNSWLETPHKQEKPKNRLCQNLCFGSKLQSNSFSKG